MYANRVCRMLFVYLRSIGYSTIIISFVHHEYSMSILNQGTLFHFAIYYLLISSFNKWCKSL